jgi:tetratricopeptide (TPR) repeat protein
MLDTYGQYADAAPQLQLAHQLSPDKQAILYELGANAEGRGDTAGALSDFATAYNLDTSDVDARVYYAAAAIEAGNDALASQLLAPVIPTGQAADPRIAQAYASRGEYGQIVSIWLAAVQADPTNTQAYFTLAAAYYAAGDPANAIAQLKAAEAEDPSSAQQAEQLIQEIQSGTIKVQ